MTRSALLRYNFRVMLFHNWWLLVIPLAASQLSVFWNLITQRFTPSLPASSVEMVSPLLAAFLGAHILSAEYRSGIGAILASKPVHIGKVVIMRLSVVMALVWGLGLLSLLAFRFGMEEYSLWQPAVSGMVSSLFLALLALTFATLFRNPLAGFGVAGLYWLLDLPPGPPLNPFLSLRSLSASYPPPGVVLDSFVTDYWWVSKAVLLALAVILYFAHGRILFTLGSPLTQKRRRRTMAWAGGLLAVYLVTGAMQKVSYGYAHRGTLFPSDAAWFRRQFAPYGPIPVASLFGPNFRRYLGDVPNAWRIRADDEADLLGDSAAHRKDLHRVLDNAPGSLWAPSAAELLSQIEARKQKTVEGKVAYYRTIIDQYPTSPFVPAALRQEARVYLTESRKEGTPDAERKSLEDRARTVYESLLTKRPPDAFASEALGFLTENARLRGDLPKAESQARQWTQIAPLQDKFAAFLALAEALAAEGKTDETKRAAEQSLQAIKEFQRALRARELSAPGGTQTQWEQRASLTEKRAKELLEGKPN